MGSVISYFDSGNWPEICPRSKKCVKFHPTAQLSDSLEYITVEVGDTPRISSWVRVRPDTPRPGDLNEFAVLHLPPNDGEEGVVQGMIALQLYGLPGEGAGKYQYFVCQIQIDPFLTIIKISSI